MIDTLRLNPAKVKKALTEKGYTVYGRFPNKKYRDGKVDLCLYSCIYLIIGSVPNS